MPTEYSNATERMVLEEFCKKIDLEEGVTSFTKSESPDGIIVTHKGQIIGVEVTAALRTDDAAIDQNDKNRVAIFLNKFGLYNPNAPTYSTLSESLENDSYIQALLSKIKERIQEKETNRMYSDFKIRFNQKVLIVFLDDLLIDSHVLNHIISQNTFSEQVKVFDQAYLYIKTTYHTSPSGIKHIGGFYLIG